MSEKLNYWKILAFLFCTALKERKTIEKRVHVLLVFFATSQLHGKEGTDQKPLASKDGQIKDDQSYNHSIFDCSSTAARVLLTGRVMVGCVTIEAFIHGLLITRILIW